MSLFDHFEDDQVSAVLLSPTVNTPQISQMMLQSSDEHEQSHFSLDKVQFTFPGNIITMAVSNNSLAIAIELAGRNLSILRIDLEKPDAVEDIRFQTKQNDEIKRLFYSPLAAHLIICCKSGDTYYLHSSWSKPRLLSKLKVLFYNEGNYNHCN